MAGRAGHPGDVAWRAVSLKGKRERAEQEAPKAPSAPRWATAAACAIVALLAPTGFEPALIYWNLALLAGGVYTLYRFAQGAAPRVPKDGLQWFLVGGAGIAGFQLAAGNTCAPFLTLQTFQFWCGSLLLLPLLREGLAERLLRRSFLSGTAVVLLGLFAVALVTGTHAVFGASTEHMRTLWWPFLYRNHLAGLVLLTLPILVWHLAERSRAWWVAGVAGLLGVAAVVASGSRAGIALVILEVLVLLWVLTRHDAPKRRLAVAGLGIAGLFMATALGGTAVLRYRLAQGSPLLEGRLEYWQASLAMVAERPLAGWGFGTWPEVYRQFQTYDSGLIVNHAHSDWLEWTAEGGVAVALLMAAMAMGAIRHARCHPWALGLPLLLVFGAADYTLRQPLVWVVFLTVWLAAEAHEPPSAAGGTGN